MASPSDGFGGCIMIVLGVTGLLMSLCGGFYTIATLTDVFGSGDAGEFAKAILTLSVPSLIVGLVLGFVSLKYIKSSGRDAQFRAQSPPPADAAQVDPKPADDDSTSHH
jgi:hypothetical protein